VLDPCQSSISACARSITDLGSTAGPAEKLYVHFIIS